MTASVTQISIQDGSTAPPRTLERDHGDVQPVQDHADGREDRGLLDEPYALPPDATT